MYCQKLKRPSGYLASLSAAIYGNRMLHRGGSAFNTATKQAASPAVHSATHHHALLHVDVGGRRQRARRRRRVLRRRRRRPAEEAADGVDDDHADREGLDHRPAPGPHCRGGRGLHRRPRLGPLRSHLHADLHQSSGAIPLRNCIFLPVPIPVPESEYSNRLNQVRAELELNWNSYHFNWNCSRNCVIWNWIRNCLPRNWNPIRSPSYPYLQ